METKGLTCKIPLDLHNRITEEIRAKIAIPAPSARSFSTTLPEF